MSVNTVMVKQLKLCYRWQSKFNDSIKLFTSLLPEYPDFNIRIKTKMLL